MCIVFFSHEQLLNCCLFLPQSYDMNLKDLHNFVEFYLDGVYTVLQSLTVPPLIYFHYVKRRPRYS